MYVLNFFDRVAKHRSFSFLKCDSTTYSLPAILKFSGQKKEISVVESVFGMVVGGWIGQLELF